MSFACALKCPLNGWIQKHWHTLMHLFFASFWTLFAMCNMTKFWSRWNCLACPCVVSESHEDLVWLLKNIKNPKGTFDSEMLMNSTFMYPSGWNSHTVNVFWQGGGALFMVHMLQFPFSLSQSTWDMLLQNQADSSLEHRENIEIMYSRPSRQCSASPLRLQIRVHKLWLWLLVVYMTRRRGLTSFFGYFWPGCKTKMSFSWPVVNLVNSWSARWLTWSSVVQQVLECIGCGVYVFFERSSEQEYLVEPNCLYSLSWSGTVSIKFHTIQTDMKSCIDSNRLYVRPSHSVHFCPCCPIGIVAVLSLGNSQVHLQNARRSWLRHSRKRHKQHTLHVTWCHILFWIVHLTFVCSMLTFAICASCIAWPFFQLMPWCSTTARKEPWMGIACVKRAHQGSKFPNVVVVVLCAT